MIKACIFDLDGVVVYTDKYHYKAWRKLARHMGYDLTPFENMMLKGLSRMDSLDALLKMKGVEAENCEKLMLCDLKNKWYQKFIREIDESSIAPGAPELVQALRSAGIKTAIASSSKNAIAVLRGLKLESLFDVIVDGNMISSSKPDPEIFLKCAQMLKVDPKDCVVLEDSNSGAIAARKAGMHIVGIGGEFEFSSCDIKKKSISDVTLDEILQPRKKLAF